ncbi:hypothetical protein HZ326_15352 [Fusarium oxysporum f. sp. albedinis]|nr:hypothetical protein HZ326_15352 [Fusarium oxysporum f. sp. albedinis]
MDAHVTGSLAYACISGSMVTRHTKSYCSLSPVTSRRLLVGYWAALHHLSFAALLPLDLAAPTNSPIIHIHNGPAQADDPISILKRSTIQPPSCLLNYIFSTPVILASLSIAVSTV